MGCQKITGVMPRWFRPLSRDVAGNDRLMFAEVAVGPPQSRQMLHVAGTRPPVDWMNCLTCHNCPEAVVTLEFWTCESPRNSWRVDASACSFDTPTKTTRPAM